MTYIVIVLLVALAAAAAVFVSGRGLASDISDIRQVAARGVPVNLAAFRQLHDPRDYEFLRTRLSGRDLRKVLRLRSRASVEYLSAIFHNTAVLIRVGELARSGSELDVAAAGTRLLNVAMRVRLLASIAIARASLNYLWPQNAALAEPLIDEYESLRAQVAIVALMQAPAESSRLSSAI